MEVEKQNFCLLVLPSITKALYRIGKKDAALGFAAFKMLNDYAITGEEPQIVDDDLTLSVLFDTIAPIIDGSRRKIEAQRENGKKRWSKETTPIEEAATEEATTEEATEPEVIEPEVIILSESENLQREWQKYWQDLCVTTGLPLARLNEYKEQFDAHCRVSKKEHKDLKDWQNHFYAWLCAVLKNRRNREKDDKAIRDYEFAEHIRERLDPNSEYSKECAKAEAYFKEMHG